MYRSFQRYELELLLSLAAGIVSSGGAGLQAGKERTFSSWCVSKTSGYCWPTPQCRNPCVQHG